MIMKEYGLRVFLAPGFTDMRKSINGLSVLVDDLDLDPFSGHMFVFCNRRQTNRRTGSGLAIQHATYNRRKSNNNLSRPNP